LEDGVGAPALCDGRWDETLKNGNPLPSKERVSATYCCLAAHNNRKTVGSSLCKRSLRRKLSAIAASGGSPRDAYDLDRFLVRLPLRYYDSDLDSPPTVQQVNTLVKLGVPRWPLINRGIVGEVFALLKARRENGLSSVAQAWNVGAELYRLKREEKKQ
jgi:hypothetical protein